MFGTSIDVIVCDNKLEIKDAFVPAVYPMSEIQLLHALGYKKNLPVAEWIKHYYGLSGQWYVLSPLRWEATHRDVFVRGIQGALAISDEESRRIFQLYMPFAAEINVQLYYHNATTWLMRCDNHPFPATAPACALMNHSLSEFMDALRGNPFWLNFLTESQMFLEKYHSVMNGIWIWGGEPMTRKKSNRPFIVCGDEHWLIPAKQVAKRVECFDKRLPIYKNGIYFVPNLHWLKVSQLEAHLEGYSVNWHYINVELISQKPTWFSRWFQR